MGMSFYPEREATGHRGDPIKVSPSIDIWYSTDDDGYFLQRYGDFGAVSELTYSTVDCAFLAWKAGKVRWVK
jgi:hypothetical protein